MSGSYSDAATVLASSFAEAECLRERATGLMRSSVRRAAAAGMTQRQIATAIGRSQPEVSRLLRFAPASDLGRRLATRRREVIDLLRNCGHKNPRVFGSVANGTDGPESDIDLLVDVAPGTDLFDLVRCETALSDLLGHKVDLIPANSLRPHIERRVLAEAVAL